MLEPLSKMERRILEYIIDYLKRNTYQPSIREIGKRFGIKSTKTVSEYLQSLADKGYIEREVSRSRGVKILGLELHRPQTISVPYYGRVAPGEPALREDHVTREIEVDPSLVSTTHAFFLRVQGDSMVGAGILDGDLALVEPTSKEDLQDGEIVAARLGGEGTIKRYFRRGDMVVLEPADPEGTPVFAEDYDDFLLLGRVTGIFRRLAAPSAQDAGHSTEEGSAQGG